MITAAQPEIEARSSAGVEASLVEYLHACPICRRDDLRHYCRVPSLFNPGQFIHYERCAGCGTVLRNPRLPPDYRLQRYEDGEVTPQQLRLDPGSQLHYAYMMRLLRRRMPAGAGRRLLDFGCGAGGFLLAARESGFEPHGLELSRGLARHVQEAHGIPVFQGLITDPAFAGERFEVIVTSQVFEHLLDPRETLAELRRHLEPPGFLLVEVPNLRDVRERLRRGRMMDDSHLFYFSARSLSYLLIDEGLQVLEVHEGLRPFRHFGELGRRVPDRLVRAAERLFSICQVKTGLSVLARLRLG